MSSEVTRAADNVLSHWADCTKKNNLIGTEVKISGIYKIAVPSSKVLIVEEHVIDYIDHVVGQMHEPLKRVVKRYYLDQKINIENGKKKIIKRSYYPQHIRTIKDKSASEDLSEANFINYLTIARHLIYQKLSDLNFV